MLLRVIQHGCTDAIASAGTLQHIVVAAPFASTPEGFVVGQFCKGYGYISQFGIDFHYCTTAGETKQFGVWPTQAAQSEGGLLDALGQSLSAELFYDDKS